MVYVALLRGINVGGKNKIDMKLLKETFVRTGMESVTTYINSGNVIFTNMKHTKTEITNLLEEAIFRYFQLNIKVLIRSLNDFEHMIKVLPESWRDDKNMRSDVLFLWEEFDRKTVINELKIKPEVDTVMYVPGAILWTLDKVNITKSRLNKFIGTDVYKKMTARNFNTTRKIYEIMKGLE